MPRLVFNVAPLDVFAARPYHGLDCTKMGLPRQERRRKSDKSQKMLDIPPMAVISLVLLRTYRAGGARAAIALAGSDDRGKKEGSECERIPRAGGSRGGGPGRSSSRPQRSCSRSRRRGRPTPRPHRSGAGGVLGRHGGRERQLALTAPQTLNLSATDDVAVAKFQYSLDGGATYIDVPVTAGPSASASVVISQEGNTTVRYRAVDTLGEQLPRRDHDTTLNQAAAAGATGGPAREHDRPHRRRHPRDRHGAARRRRRSRAS